MSSFLVRTNSESLFPVNPRNDYFEKDANINIVSIHRAESLICGISSAISLAVIGDRLLKKVGIALISNEYLNPLCQVSLLVSASLLVAGLCVTRFKLRDLNLGPSLDESNSLSKHQVIEFLSRAQKVQSVKFLHPQDDRRLTQMISTLENINSDQGYNLAYVMPTDRDNLKQFEDFEKDVESNAKSQAQIEGLLKVINKTRKKSMEEFVWNKILFKAAEYPPRLAKAEELRGTLETIIEEIDDVADTSLIYIDPNINGQISQLEEKEGLKEVFEPEAKENIPSKEEDQNMRRPRRSAAIYFKNNSNDQ